MPQLNAEGQKIVQGYFKGIIDLRERAQAGDIPGLMTNIGGTGEPGLKKLIHIVPEPWLVVPFWPNSLRIATM